MPDLANSPTPHTELVDQAVARLSPRWTTWTLQTMQQHGPMRLTELNSALPWVGVHAMAQIVRRMQTSNLLDRPQFGVYDLTPLGRHTNDVHRALSAWHRIHLTDGTSSPGEAERVQPEPVEVVLSRLRGKGTIPLLHTLAQHGPLPNGALRDEAGLATGSFHYRITQLQTHQLITRTSPFSGRGTEYTLTSAARGLTPVYAELAEFARKATPATALPDEHGATAQYAIRASAAVHRSPVASSELFSHVPDSPPRVPAYVTALSHPSRTR
ncbi:winged helix-turn-helix transcriptional regulator [Streptomyces cylindrosporus]|uniref:Winged helix-turn-helix transcriptional regulator n=1 Tax=Streptomyces cylindrosporus TaxID=2927583 RepID=A0ABS9Y070_9ACTN|nr:winged helix-turn-helix transcriptional regulator [Streptomyces cylindrosporus]MCI3270621.1 winged helix-turn-helix transcriptional regulator [Streptomyces cylindrosporus]